MSYFDGFVAPVRAGVTREAFLDYVRHVDSVFREHGATRIVEGWGDDVPHGKQTDLWRAVSADKGERVVFSWVEWPDKAARDRGWDSAMADPRIEQAGEMPFDGKRMIFGGFEAVLDIAGEPI